MATGQQRLLGGPEQLVIYISGSRWEGPPGHDRRMAEALSSTAPVVFVEPPTSPLRRTRGPGEALRPQLRLLSPALAHLTTPVPPGHTRPGLNRVALAMIRRAIRRAVPRLHPGADPAPAAAILSSRVEDLWSVVPARRRVFYATDDGVAGAELMGISRERLVRDENRTLRRADAVAVVSPALRDRYASLGVESTLIPNGCDPDFFAEVDDAPPAAVPPLPGPVAGFIGHVNDRIDLSLLESVADAGVALLIVGPVAAGYQADRFGELAARPNVTWVGPKPYSEIPSYMRMIDVGLTPYAVNDFNRASFPLKTLEYLAAGRGVVATPLPANEWLNTSHIEVAQTPDAFGTAVRAALAAPRTSALEESRRAFARQHSWGDRAAMLARLLDLRAAG